MQDRPEQRQRPTAAQQRLIDVGVAYWRRMVSEDAPLGIELLPDDAAVVVSHDVRGGGRIYVASDETVLFAGSAAPPHEAIDVFRSGRRTPPEQFRARERAMTAGRRSQASQSEGAGASLITEDELDVVWGDRAIRQAAWGRELLGRLLTQRGLRLDRAQLRYAVTSGPDELAVVYPAEHAVVYVAPDGSVLHAEADGLRREHYDAFTRGERTAIERFGAATDAGGLARAAIPGLAAGLAARAHLDVISRRPGELLAVGDMELQWLIAEEDGALVSYRVERGVARELARSTDAAVAVRAVELSLGLAEHGER